jgi:excisionase family DNA binding protein
MTIPIDQIADAIADKLNIRRYYSPTELAKILGIDSEGILELIHSGELAASNIARSRAAGKPRWRISQEALDRFMASRAKQSVAPKRRIKTKVKDYFK